MHTIQRLCNNKTTSQTSKRPTHMWMPLVTSFAVVAYLTTRMNASEELLYVHLVYDVVVACRQRHRNWIASLFVNFHPVDTYVMSLHAIIVEGHLPTIICTARKGPCLDAGRHCQLCILEAVIATLKTTKLSTKRPLTP